MKKYPVCGFTTMSREVSMKRIRVLFLGFLVFLVSCSSLNSQENGSAATNLQSGTASSESAIFTASEEPQNGDELCSAFRAAWKAGDVSALYKYVSDELSSLFSEEEFVGIFHDLNDIFGEIREFTELGKQTDSDPAVFSFRAVYENAYADVTLSVKDLELSGISYDLRMTNPFEKKYENGVTERYFLLKSGAYELNAVYCFSEKEKAPAVLLIPGSGSSDFNESVGLLTPFRDIAMGLAEKGVHSLRLEKRTCRYANAFSPKDGLDEEYFIDFGNALEWLKAQEETEDVYLLGHSLGGQIAAKMAEGTDVAGVILLNSSARHFADILADQYTAIDPANRSLYAAYANAAKNAVSETAEGLYYYGATDSYWASYNKLETVDSVRTSVAPFLILNGTFDRQLFEEALALWQNVLSGNENVTLKQYDGVSHFGYRIDTTDEAELYSRSEFPTELLADMTAFMQNDTE